MSFRKKKYFVLKTVFFIHEKCMCEGVGEDSRHRAGHVDIRVRMHILVLECVCVVAIACALRWGVALVGEFNYWAMLTSSWENIFKYWRYIGG